MSIPARVVLITGATSGIGHATALAFARAGWRVAATGRRADRGRDLVASIAAAGGTAIFIPADHSLETDAVRSVAETVQAFGRLDAAFNNAGTEGVPGLMTTQQTEANFRQTMDLNVGGVLWAMKHEIPAMLANGGGSIVNTSSVAGHVGMAGMAVYVASKHAVEGLTRNAALEYATQGIRVNAVAPAAIQTEMVDRFVGPGDSEQKKWLASLHPMRRVGTVDEVAAAVLFLCSAEASFITGQSLPVDGGFLAQ